MQMIADYRQIHSTSWLAWFDSHQVVSLKSSMHQAGCSHNNSTLNVDVISGVH